MAPVYWTRGRTLQHSQHVASSLQPLEGGKASVDLLTQVDVLQAKIVACMHHTRRHPWKLLMKAAIRWRSPPPPHLRYALPFFPSASLPRRADCLVTIWRTAPLRVVVAADMPVSAILLEG